MTTKVPLKEMLLAMDRGDKQFYSRLSDDQKKTFSPWLAMRYASSVKGRFAEHYLLMTNDIVNHQFSALSKHHDLQWKLLSVCGVGSSQYHEWIKPPKKKGKNKVQAAISKLFPNYKADELALFEALHTKKEIKDLFKSAGYPDNEIKALM